MVLPFLPVTDLPEHRRGLRPVPKGTSSTPHTHHLEEFLQPSEVTGAYYDVLRIDGRQYRSGQARYLVSEWAPETLTQQQIDAYKLEGFKPISINPDREYEHPPPPPPPPPPRRNLYGTMGTRLANRRNPQAPSGLAGLADYIYGQNKQ